MKVVEALESSAAFMLNESVRRPPNSIPNELRVKWRSDAAALRELAAALGEYEATAKVDACRSLGAGAMAIREREGVGEPDYPWSDWDSYQWRAATGWLNRLAALLTGAGGPGGERE